MGLIPDAGGESPTRGVVPYGGLNSKALFAAYPAAAGEKTTLITACFSASICTTSFL